METLVGLILLFLFAVFVVYIALVIFKLLCQSFLLRLVVGIGLIWIIWANVSVANEPMAWVGTAIVGLGILSPWLVVIALGGFIAGFLITRR